MVECMCRQRTSESDGNCVAEDEQLLSAVYTLLRAGATQMVENLCTRAACGWRAAVMCSTGWAMLPVSRVSTQGESTRNIQAQQAAVAADILNRVSYVATPGCIASACVIREQWRAACAAAAADAAQRCGSGSATAVAATYERAFFGALSGSLDHCQGVCSSWQDQLWAWGRAVLQSEPEQRLQEDAVAEGTFSPVPVRQVRAWHKHNMIGLPCVMPDAPSARVHGSILEQANVRSL